MSKKKILNALDTGDFIPLTLTEKQVADYIGISTVLLQKWIEKGMILETIKFNGYDTKRYLRDDVIAAFNQNKINRIYEENRLELVNRSLLKR